ncbi:MAG: hypothetical protein ACKVQA_26275 [Burkholderiales bacterium]
MTSALLLFVGGRDSHSLLPISVILAFSYLGNRFVPEPLWEKFALWANRTSNRRLFYTRIKRLPPSRSRRIH